MKKIFTIIFLLTINLSYGQTTLTTAVDFTVTDVHGNQFNLFDKLAEGKHVLIDFFFTTCVPCINSIPTMNESFEKYGCNNGDIFYISIDLNDTNAEVLAYEENYGVLIPSVSGIQGGGNSVIIDYGISAYPSVILIAPNQDIIDQDIFPVTTQNLDAAINGLAGIEENPSACFPSQCELIFIEATSTCSDNNTPTNPNDDYHVIFVNASAVDGSTSNTFNVYTNGIISGTFSYDTGGTFALSANGSSPSLVFQDGDDVDCSASTVLDPLIACSFPCELTISETITTCFDNSTPSNPNDDSYEIFVNASVLNGSESNSFHVFNNGALVGTFTYGVGGTFTLLANGISPSLVFQDVDDANCTASTVLDPLISCSFQCELTITESSSSCNNNNTPFDISDDFYTVNVNASAVNPSVSNSFKVIFNANVLGIYTYGIGGNFTMPASADETNIVFVDLDNASCISVAALGFLSPCSDSCPATLTIDNNPITNGTYRADKEIFSSANIPNSNDVIFKAGDIIHLEIGFEVESEGTFSAENEGCGEQ